MRRTSPKTTDDSQAVSLFPFLAVLLSTMGALLLILVVMARQARLNAAQEERSPVAAIAAHADPAKIAAGPSTAELRQLEERAALLKTVRDEGLREFAESRDRLRHGDAHLRQLQDQLTDLYRQANELEQLDSQRLDDHKQAQDELERLRELIRETEARLEEKRKAASGPKSYAIVPYVGPNGTRRRPLYIECRHDAVVLQPEGIALDVSDFLGPLGPGNPLASALRAAEEYYATQSASEQDHEPYPLVLVRPEGIAAYYFVRKALEGWGTDFGYELLEKSWQLEFPLPNPQLANVQQRAIEIARARQRALAMAAPGRFVGSAGVGAGSDDAGGNSFSSFADPPMGLNGGADGWDNTSGGALGDPTGGRGGASGDRLRAAGEPLAGPATGSGVATAGPLPPGSQGGETASGQPGAARGPHEGGSQANVESFSAARPGQDASGKPSSSDSQANQRDGVGGGPAAAGSTFATGPGATGSNARGSAAGAAVGSGSGFSAVAEHAPLATDRGANWAVPQAGSGAVPVRRAIHIVVRQDHLAILPEQGASGGKSLPVETSIVKAVDPLVVAIGEHIKSWGMAGRGLYWQPVLVFKPGPDGVSHASALRRLLAGSGLEIAP